MLRLAPANVTTGRPLMPLTLLATPHLLRRLAALHRPILRMAIDRGAVAPVESLAIELRWIRGFNFGNLGQIAPRGELKGDATSNPFGQWLSPVGLFGGKLKDGLGAGRIGLRQVLEGIATTS